MAARFRTRYALRQRLKGHEDLVCAVGLTLVEVGPGNVEYRCHHKNATFMMRQQYRMGQPWNLSNRHLAFRRATRRDDTVTSDVEPLYDINVAKLHGLPLSVGVLADDYGSSNLTVYSQRVHDALHVDQHLVNVLTRAVAAQLVNADPEHVKAHTGLGLLDLFRGLKSSSLGRLLATNCASASSDAWAAAAWPVTTEADASQH